MHDTPDSDACVCTECFDDPDLRSFIEANQEASVSACSFCAAEGDAIVVCRFDELMAHVDACIRERYDLAANCLAWEGREGGWLGALYWDTPDLLREQVGIDLPHDDDGSLFWAMCSRLEHTDWCRRNPYGESPLDRLRFDWDEFTSVVKYHTRFFIDSYLPQKDLALSSDRADPRHFLNAIGDAARRLDLFVDLNTESELYRVRFQRSGAPYTLPGELGPPKRETAFVSNRMSPPGIVMFYCAMDRKTALAETCKEVGNYSIGTFRTLRPLRVLDLTRLPEPLGFFAEVPDSQEWNRHEALFFQEFVEDLTQPIDRDDRVHLGYVPTQVIVEYFRRRFQPDHEAPAVDGIRYPSSRTENGRALVLFCDRSQIVGIEDPETSGASDGPMWLELIGSETVPISEKELDDLRPAPPDAVAEGLAS